MSEQFRANERAKKRKISEFKVPDFDDVSVESLRTIDRVMYKREETTSRKPPIEEKTTTPVMNKSKDTRDIVPIAPTKMRRIIPTMDIDILEPPEKKARIEKEKVLLDVPKVSQPFALQKKNLLTKPEIIDVELGDNRSPVVESKAPILNTPQKKLSSPKHFSEKEPFPKTISNRQPSHVSDMMLPEYCMTLESNFHVGVTDTLLRHMNALNGDSQCASKLLIVTGPSGCGKNFCIRRACELGGYDCTDVDLWDEDVDAVMRDAILSRPDPYARLTQGSTKKSKRIRVVLIDALDGYQSNLIGKVCKFLNTLLNPVTYAKGKKPVQKKIHLQNNLVIFTANNRYHKNLTSWMYKLKPVEIKVTLPETSQIELLVRKSCEYLKLPMAPRIHKLVSEFSHNITSLLMKVQFLTFTEGELDTSLMTTDNPVLDIFDCAHKLLEPSDIDFEKYESTWEEGGERVTDVIFNSYPPYVKFIPDTPKMKPTSEASYFCEGLNAMHDISEAFSLLDLTYGDEMFETSLKLTVKVNLENVFIRSAKTRNVDVKSKFMVTLPPCMNACLIGKREAEALHHVYLMNTLESNKKLADFKYVPSNNYNLSDYVGIYYTQLNEERNEYLICDLFPVSASDDTGKKVSKKGWEESIHPKLEVIQFFTHKYELGENTLAKASKARVKLGNGKFFVKN